MRELNKREIRLIAQAVKTRQELVNKNSAIWKLVHEELSIGTPEGNKYRLSRDDFTNLRTCIESISGIDPLKYDEQLMSGERISVSSSLANEKYASQSPTYHRIRITTHTGNMSLKNGNCKIPPGTTLDIRYDDICIPTEVIICENLEVFNQWHLVNLPEDLRGTITCYRGHDTQTTHLNNWLKSIQNDCNIIMFPDLDPSGIKNALSPRYTKHSLLIPTAKRFEHKKYHRELFIKQTQDMYEITQLESISNDVKELIETFNVTKASYTQELMVYNQQELKLIGV